MGRRNTVTRLPAEVQTEIDDHLRSTGFTGYEAYADTLRRRGLDVSKSALHRYGRVLERRTQMLKAAAEISAAGVDAEITAELCGEATLVVVVDRAFGRSRLVSVAQPAAAVIKALKAMKG